MKYVSPKLSILILRAAAITALAAPYAATAAGPSAASVPATDPAVAAAPRPVLPDGPLQIKLMQVEGLVQYRLAEGQPWHRAEPGIVLNEGADLRTGPKSAVQFTIGPDQVATLDRLGCVHVLRANFQNGKMITDLGMKFGRTRLDVDVAGAAHISTIRSPCSTLAVRGTKVSLYDQPPYVAEARSLTGRALFRNAHRETIAFGGNAKAAVSADSEGPANTALAASLAIDPTTGRERDASELRQLTLLLSQGGFVQGNVAVGNSFVPDSGLKSLNTDGLDIVLRWGDPKLFKNEFGGFIPGADQSYLKAAGANTFADLNLFVVAPDSTKTHPDYLINPPFVYSLDPTANPRIPVLGEGGGSRLLPVNDVYPTRTRTGGHITLNHVGPQGLEIASFPKGFPSTLQTGNPWVIGVYDLVDTVAPANVQGGNVRPPANSAGNIPKAAQAQSVPFRIDILQNGEDIKFHRFYVGRVQIGHIEAQPFTIPAIGFQAGRRR